MEPDVRRTFANVASGMDKLRISEIARYLGVTRERVRQLAAREPSFPRPVESEPHRCWDRADVEAWAEHWWWDTRPWRHRDENQPLGR